MFGFGWVITHLGEVFLESIRVFFLFWLDFWKNGRNQQIWVISRVLRYGVGIPRSSVSPCHGVAERRLEQALGTPKRSKATS